MKKPQVHLSTDDAIILQQISETGEDDLANLSRSLRMHRSKVMASLESLRRKGLVTVQRTAGDWWVSLSAKGKQLSQYVWPESSMQMVH